ncbi:MAG: hypothetical protein MSA65_03540 [Mollicutes bacterium]|nr:hypothetical protein [Mollicutes bacterium]
MKYLIKTKETYRIDSENEVKNYLEELRQDARFTVDSYTSKKKQTKQKGEIIDEYILFSVTKNFNIEKEPDSEIEIEYNKKD